jgi:osmotically-inducible protein OsmY
MNWFETSILVMLGFFTCVYLILVYLTSPGRPRRRASRGRSYRAANPRDAYGSLQPRELHQVRDEELAEFVRNRLRLRPGLAQVEAAVKDGEVRLSGRVGNVDDRELAGNVARSVPQVRSVVNEVRVRMGAGEAVA